MQLATAANQTWRIRGRELSLERPVLVGIVNVTPDSFSDGGRFHHVEPALARARRSRI